MAGNCLEKDVCLSVCSVKQSSDSYNYLMEFVDYSKRIERPVRSIIICSNGFEAEMAAHELAVRGVKASTYYDDLPQAKKDESFRKWKMCKVPVLIVTSSFNYWAYKTAWVRAIAFWNVYECTPEVQDIVRSAKIDGKQLQCRVFYIPKEYNGDPELLVKYLVGAENGNKEEGRKSAGPILNIARESCSNQMMMCPVNQQQTGSLESWCKSGRAVTGDG